VRPALGKQDLLKLSKTDYIIQMIPLSVIPLSGAYCDKNLAFFHTWCILCSSNENRPAFPIAAVAEVVPALLHKVDKKCDNFVPRDFD
jgi:hypothetical protein